MAPKKHSGFVKTYSPGLRSGTVEIEVDGEWRSIPFTSEEIVGDTVRSGDRVLVTMANLQSKTKTPRATSVEREAATEANASPGPSDDDLADSIQRSTVPVDPGGKTFARFTKEKYVQSGRRLDFE